MLYTMSGPDAMYFGIYRATGQIITQAILDFESLPANKKYFNVQVTATDRAGLSDTTDVRINVVDVNEPPIAIVIGLSVVGAVRQELRGEGHRRRGYLRGRRYQCREMPRGAWPATDGRLFMVAPTSGMSTTLSFRSSPDFEMPADADGDNVYEVTVKAADTTNDDLSGTMDVMVTVTDVDEDGSITGLPASAAVGTELTAMVDDPDNDVNVTAWQWARGGSDIDGATSATYTVADSDAGMSLMATATYDDVHGMGKIVQSAAVMVMAADERPQVVQDYDTDGTQGISTDELFDAIDDFFAEEIDTDQLFDVIDAYFASNG